MFQANSHCIYSNTHYSTLHATVTSPPSDQNHYQVVIRWQLSPSLHPGHNTSSLMRQLQSQSLIFGPKCSAPAKSTRFRVGQSGTADFVFTLWHSVNFGAHFGKTLCLHFCLLRPLLITSAKNNFCGSTQSENKQYGLTLQPRLNPAFCTLSSSHLVFGLL